MAFLTSMTHTDHSINTCQYWYSLAFVGFKERVLVLLQCHVSWPLH